MRKSTNISFKFLFFKNIIYKKNKITIGTKEPKNNNWIPVPKADREEIFNIIINLFFKLNLLIEYLIK